MWRASNSDAAWWKCLAIEFSMEHSVRDSRRRPMVMCLGTSLLLNAMGRIDIVTNAAIINYKLLFRLLIEPSRSRKIGDVY